MTCRVGKGSKETGVRSSLGRAHTNEKMKRPEEPSRVVFHLAHRFFDLIDTRHREVRMQTNKQAACAYERFRRGVLYEIRLDRAYTPHLRDQRSFALLKVYRKRSHKEVVKRSDGTCMHIVFNTPVYVFKFL